MTELVNGTFSFSSALSAGSGSAFSPPEHLLSDYIEIAYLGLLILTGLPFNLYILRRLIKQKASTQKDGIKMGFMLLKINLCISDLTLILMSVINVIWLLTYQWPGGDALCRLSQFWSMFCLYGSTNIMICIAVDRLRNVLSVSKISSHSVALVKCILWIAWIGALLGSLGQLVVWRTIDISTHYHFKEPFIQCTDIWNIYKAFNVTSNLEPLLSIYVEHPYKIIHLALVFWGPLLTLMILYVIIAIKLMKYSMSDGPGKATSITARNSEYTETAKLTVENDSSILRKISSFGRKKNKLSIALLKKGRQSSENLITLPDTIGESKIPSWRKQLRSRVFRTTLLIVILHFVLWFPFNAHALCYYLNPELYGQLSDHANIFKHIQFLIVLINPFIYGFS